MPDLWRIEYHVMDASGEVVDWLGGKREAIEAAKAIGGSVEEVREYLPEREIIWSEGSEDDE